MIAQLLQCLLYELNDADWDKTLSGAHTITRPGREFDISLLTSTEDEVSGAVPLCPPYAFFKSTGTVLTVRTGVNERSS